MFKWTKDYVQAINAVHKASSYHQRCVLRRESSGENSVLSYSNALTLLSPHRDWLLDELHAHLRKFEPFELLWLIRMVPVESMPIPAGMRQLARLLVEQQVGIGREGTVYGVGFNNIIIIEYTYSQLVDLVRALALAWQYHEVSGLIRATSMGAEYRVAPDGTFNEIDLNNRKVISEFIERRDKDRVVLWALGVPEDLMARDRVALETVWLVNQRDVPADMAIAHYDWQNKPTTGKIPERISVRYSVGAVFELGQLLDVFGEHYIDTAIHKVLKPSMLCKIALAMIVTGRENNDLSQFINTTTRGVNYLSTQAIHKTNMLAYPQVYRHITENYGEAKLPNCLWDLLRILAVDQADSKRMMTGPAVWFNEDGVLIDLIRVTMSMVTELVHDVRLDGELGNQIGKYHEESVRRIAQKTIVNDKLDLAGKELRINGNALTDLDAIVQLDRGAILVSCKANQPGHSYYDIEQLGQRYSRGKTIDQYHADWEETVKFIDSNRVGDNYDLRDVGELHAITCTPMILWHDKIAEVGDIRGLPCVCSINELNTWVTDELGI